MAKISYTVEEAAEMLSCGVQLVRRLYAKKYIKGLWLGRGLKINHKSLVDFIEKYEGYDFTDLDNPILISETKLKQLGK